MADTVIRTLHYWLSNHGDAHTFVIIKVVTTLQWSLRVMGSFTSKEKNANFWIEYFPFEKIFSTEIKNGISDSPAIAAPYMFFYNHGSLWIIGKMFFSVFHVFLFLHTSH